MKVPPPDGAASIFGPGSTAERSFHTTRESFGFIKFDNWISIDGIKKCYSDIVPRYQSGEECSTWGLWEHKQGDDLMSLLWPALGVAVVVTIYRWLFERWAARCGWAIVARQTGWSRDSAGADDFKGAARENIDRQSLGELSAVLEKGSLTSPEEVRYAEHRIVKMQFEANLKKYKETCWRLLSYAILVILGIFATQKDWAFRDPYQQWAPWGQKFEVDALSESYYIIEIGFYIHLFVAQFFDVRRKDFVAMFIHHCATLWLLLFSRYEGFWRVGVSIVFLHDINDVFMEAAKLFKKQGNELICNIFFALFTVSWVVTRFYYFPQQIFSSLCIHNDIKMRTTDPESPNSFTHNHFEMCVLQWNAIVLLCLHVYWFYFILKILLKALIFGEVNDERNYASKINARKKAA